MHYHYTPAATGGHRLRCRCWLCQRYPSPLRRAARAAALFTATCALCLGYLALGAWLDA